MKKFKYFGLNYVFLIEKKFLKYCHLIILIIPLRRLMLSFYLKPLKKKVHYVSKLSNNHQAINYFNFFNRISNI